MTFYLLVCPDAEFLPVDVPPLRLTDPPVLLVPLELLLAAPSAFLELLELLLAVVPLLLFEPRTVVDF